MYVVYFGTVATKWCGRTLWSDKLTQTNSFDKRTVRHFGHEGTFCVHLVVHVCVYLVGTFCVHHVIDVCVCI